MRVCVPVCEQDVDALRSACDRAAELADLIELRLDCVDEFPAGLEDLVHDLSCPLILTFRPSEQGGHRNSTREERKTFWTSIAPRAHEIWWDIEGDLADDLSPDWSRVIASHHDFSGVSGDLDRIYERLASTPAAVLKIAVQANDITDCVPVFQLLERALNEGREVIAIAMGNPGIATRVLGPARGSFLTYGALDDESGTAPGQITASKLRSLYHLDQIDKETMICGVVGLPVMHSLSPEIHNTAFQAEGINGVYLPFEVKDVSEFFRRMVDPRTRELDWNLRGLSVTAPHKQTVMGLLDWIEPAAKEIGAVNTVVIENERLLGYNTDAAGFIEPLLGRFEGLSGKRVAVIGAGGAARAAVWALQREKASVTLFARDVMKAKSLAESFNLDCKSLSSASFDGYDLVINATPVGSGAYVDQSPVTREQLNGARCVYDLIYTPAETCLIRDAKGIGCKTLGGMEMLVAQAKLQFRLFTADKTRMM